MNALTLYHGSNTAFDAVDLSRPRDRRDFGRGFYTTTIKEQAEKWAASLFDRYAGDGKKVYVMEFTRSADLRAKEFDGLTLEWLEMVKENRVNGGLRHAYDIVKGPVADDNTMPTIALYVDGTLSAEAALVQLAYFKANDQISFHTERAIKNLKIVKRIDI
jgi:hypothetical protein